MLLNDLGSYPFKSVLYRASNQVRSRKLSIITIALTSKLAILLCGCDIYATNNDSTSTRSLKAESQTSRVNRIGREISNIGPRIIDSTEDIVTSHVVHNNFPNPLTITAFANSKPCCASIFFDGNMPLTIGPGDRFLIKVKLKRGIRPGPFEQTTVLSTDNPSLPSIELITQATLIPKYITECLSPQTFSTGSNVNLNYRLTFHSLVKPRTEPFDNAALTTAGDKVRANWDGDPETEEIGPLPIYTTKRKIRITAQPESSTGHHAETIQLTTLNGKSLYRFDARYEIEDDFSCSPSAMMVSFIGGETRKTLQLVVKSSSATSFRIIAYKLEDSAPLDISVALPSLSALRHVIPVTIQSTSKSIVKPLTLILTTDQPHQRTIHLPILIRNGM
jgi:hypothetical protein